MLNKPFGNKASKRPHKPNCTFWLIVVSMVLPLSFKTIPSLSDFQNDVNSFFVFSLYFFKLLEAYFSYDAAEEEFCKPCNPWLPFCQFK